MSLLPPQPRRQGPQGASRALNAAGAAAARDRAARDRSGPGRPAQGRAAKGRSPNAKAAKPAQGRRAVKLWWLHPSLIILLVLVPVYISVMAFDFKRRTPIAYVPGWDYAFGLLLLLSMVAGVQWALAQRHTVRELPPPHISLGVMMLLLLPTLMAYAVWFGPLLQRPDLLLEVAAGTRAEVRDDISTVKGVTTFSQFGLVYVIAYAIKASAHPHTVTRIEKAGLVLLLLLACFRAFAWAERLAVLELLVCFTVTRLAYLRLKTPLQWRLASTLPALAPFALYGLFTATEYFRSWEFLSNQYNSVWELSLDRLITYYATAINNGVGALTETPGWPFYSGAFIFESLWLAPGLGPLLEAAFGNDRVGEAVFLKTFGNPAMNSPTAYFRTVLDLGYFGAVVFYTGLGYLIGRAYMGLQRGHVFGLLMYGVLVLHLVESLRYGYLGETRFVPAALGLALVALHIHRQRRQGPVA